MWPLRKASSPSFIVMEAWAKKRKTTFNYMATMFICTLSHFVDKHEDKKPDEQSPSFGRKCLNADIPHPS